MVEALLQVSIENIPTPTFNAIIWFVFGLLMGLLAPTYYAAERLRGFSRAMLGKLPYQPPPGKEEGEALAEATNSDEELEE